VKSYCIWGHGFRGVHASPKPRTQMLMTIYSNNNTM